MKIRVLILLILFIFSPLINAQKSHVYDKLTMESIIFSMSRNYVVYLPPRYEESVGTLWDIGGSLCPKCYGLFLKAFTKDELLHLPYLARLFLKQMV